MISLIERVKVWLSLRVLWKANPELKFEAIRNFQATEADGVFHLLRGVRRTPTAKEKAILISHIIEEESHADIFASVYSRESNRAMVPSFFERENLYSESDPLWKLIAYVHVGEDDATLRFNEMLRFLDDGPLKSALEKIVRDEEGHIGLTEQLAGKMGASPRQLRGEALRVRLRRLKSQWFRMGERVINHLSSVLLAMTYLVFGLLLAPSARKKLKERVVNYDNNRVKMLRDSKKMGLAG